MEVSNFFKAIIDADTAAVVICNPEHIVVYMNPSSVRRYHVDLTGKSIKDCHNAETGEKIERVVEWFRENEENNTVFTFGDEKKDVYMVALRDENKNLIGYYEKHESRIKEAKAPYEF